MYVGKDFEKKCTLPAHSWNKTMAPTIVIWFITVMSHESSSVSNHPQLDCLLNLRANNKRKTMSELLSLCVWNPPVRGGFFSQIASKSEGVAIFWVCFLSHILSLVTLHVTRPHFRTQLTYEVFCLSVFKWLHKSLEPWLNLAPGHLKPSWWRRSVGVCW